MSFGEQRQWLKELADAVHVAGSLTGLSIRALKG